MSYTFLDQQNKLSRLLGDANTSSDDAFPLDDRKKEINRGEVQFAKDTKMLMKKITGTVSNQEISLPSDWFETYVLVVNNDNFSVQKLIFHVMPLYPGDHLFCLFACLDRENQKLIRIRMVLAGDDLSDPHFQFLKLIESNHFFLLCLAVAK